MYVIIAEHPTYLLRFLYEEDVFAGLITFCKEHSIKAATFSAIGASSKAVISFYHLTEKRYDDWTQEGDHEIVGLSGNFALLNDKPFVHCHGTFSAPDYSVIGGHIKELIAGATCEMTVTAFSGTIKRAYDEETGLNLLEPEQPQH